MHRRLRAARSGPGPPSAHPAFTSFLTEPTPNLPGHRAGQVYCELINVRFALNSGLITAVAAGPLNVNVFSESGTFDPSGRYPPMYALLVQRNEIFKPIIKMAAAAVVAGLIVFATSAAPMASIPNVNGAQLQVSVKGDRLPLAVKGTACSRREWPHYEQSCLFNYRRSADEVRTVRILNLDKREIQLRAPHVKVLALR